MSSLFGGLARRVARSLGYRLERPPPFVTFDEKLLHNYHELDEMERSRYHSQVRPGLSPEEVFFFEGDPRLHGQMYLAERRALFDFVRSRRPSLVIEIGTFTGGGSTFFIASALHRVSSGTLASSEANLDLHRLATTFYETCLPALAPHVRFIHGAGTTFFDSVIEEHGGVDLLLLDGAEDRRESTDQFHALQGRIRRGGAILLHDWNTKKMLDLRPLLEGAPGWRSLFALTPPESVGFAGFEKL